MHAVQKLKAVRVMARVVCFPSSTMEPSTTSVRTMKTTIPGVQQQQTMILTACGVAAMVSKLHCTNGVEDVNWGNRLMKRR